MNRLVNTLKHDSDDKGRKLMAVWPEVLPRDFDPSLGWRNWYDVVSLSDADVLHAFDIVAASAPTTN